MQTYRILLIALLAAASASALIYDPNQKAHIRLTMESLVPKATPQEITDTFLEEIRHYVYESYVKAGRAWALEEITVDTLPKPDLEELQDEWLQYFGKSPIKYLLRDYLAGAELPTGWTRDLAKDLFEAFATLLHAMRVRSSAPRSSDPQSVGTAPLDM